MTTAPVIVGAGPSGSLCALLLAKRGIPSILLDKAVFPRNKTCGDALSGKAIRALQQLETNLPIQLACLPQSIAYDRLLLTSPSGRQASLTLPPNHDLGDIAPGYLIGRYHLDEWLLTLARSQHLITIHQGEKVTNAERLPGAGIRLHLSSGTQIDTPLAIGADGAHSVLAASLAGHRLQRRYHAAAIRAYYTGVTGLTSALELYFLQGIQPGYLWIFRMPDGMANVGLICRSDVVAHKKLNINQILDDTLKTNPIFASRFAHASRQGRAEGQGLPTALQKRKITGANFILLGDAAGLADPFTYEGIGNALLSATLAADTIAKAYKSGNYSAEIMADYSTQLYKRLRRELIISRLLQQASQSRFMLNTGIWMLQHMVPLAGMINWAVRKKRKTGL